MEFFLETGFIKTRNPFGNKRKCILKTIRFCTVLIKTLFVSSEYYLFQVRDRADSRVNPFFWKNHDFSFTNLIVLNPILRLCLVRGSLLIRSHNETNGNLNFTRKKNGIMFPKTWFINNNNVKMLRMFGNYFSRISRFMNKIFLDKNLNIKKKTIRESDKNWIVFVWTQNIPKKILRF